MGTTRGRRLSFAFIGLGLLGTVLAFVASGFGVWVFNNAKNAQADAQITVGTWTFGSGWCHRSGTYGSYDDTYLSDEGITYTYDDTKKTAVLTKLDIMSITDTAARAQANCFILPSTVTKDGVTYTVTGTAIGNNGHNIFDLTSSANDSKKAAVGSKQLEYFDIEDNAYLTSFDNNTLQGLDNLKEIAFLPGTGMKTATLVDGSSVTYHTRCENLTSIGQQAFYNNPNLTRVVLPTGITNLGPAAFSKSATAGLILNASYCHNITTLSSSSSDSSAGVLSIYSASSSSLTNVAGNRVPLADVDLWGTNITNIPAGFFCNGDTNNNDARANTTLTGVYLPTTVTSIEAKAFSHCTALDITGLETTHVKTVGTNAFWRDYSAKFDSLPSTYDSDSSGINIYINTGIETLDLSECSEVQNIRDGSFNHCAQLTVLKLPHSLTTLSKKCFYENWRLQDIYYYGTLAEWNSITKDTNESGKTSWDYDTGVLNATDKTRTYTIHYLASDTATSFASGDVITVTHTAHRDNDGNNL